jgi:hypothetical protein
MLSIVVVYNDERALNRILLKSLKNQTTKFEFIPVDNTQGRFQSAAEALNYGGKQASGKYVMFVHQDVDLGSDSWLETVEKALDDISDLGIAGVAGMSEKGKNYWERKRGRISSCGEVWGNPLQKPEEVQTLDECLLIVPKSVFSKLQFDEKTFDGWHCYGVDYCLSVNKIGLQPYVIPAFIYHRSLTLNVENLLRYQKRLYNKHRKNYKKIYTTCGEISWLKLRLSLLIEVLSPLYKRLFPGLIENLKKELASCDTVLDLGCGYSSAIQYCNVPFSVGVELFEPYLEESIKKGIHNQYIKADVTRMEFTHKSFDAVIALNLLEHLTKQEGAELLSKMESWATKKVVVFTPNGYIWQNAYDDNALQEHRSGWSADEFRELGYKVYGMNGWKRLRGHRASIKHKPTFLWGRISDLTQKITRRCPNQAFQLLAIKEIKVPDKE